MYTGGNIQLTFDSVDCIKGHALVFPNKIVPPYYYVRQGKQRSEVILTVVPTHFLYRDDWPGMDTGELSTQKSEYDIEQDPETRAQMFRDLIED